MKQRDVISVLTVGNCKGATLMITKMKTECVKSMFRWGIKLNFNGLNGGRKKMANFYKSNDVDIDFSEEEKEI